MFPYVESNQKQLDAAEAHNPDGLIQKAITKIKLALPELGIITDIALDPFTTHGHDGILNEDGEIDNEITIDILKKQAITHANAGADILAPSDMMDGRIGMIRGFWMRIGLKISTFFHIPLNLHHLFTVLLETLLEVARA